MAAELGNVRAACRAMGIHSSTYYRWKRRLDHHGPVILRPRERRVPRMAHATRPPGRAAGGRSSRKPQSEISKDLGVSEQSPRGYFARETDQRCAWTKASMWPASGSPG